MKTANEFMKEAIELSRVKMQEGCGGPFGAVIVKDGEIVGRGWNTVTSSNDPTAHAEVGAIRDACRNLDTFELNGCELYTSCEPCPMCLSAVYWARIEKVYYGNHRKDAADIEFDDEWIYQEVAKSIEQRQIPMIPMGRTEALSVFKEWQDKADRIKY